MPVPELDVLKPIDPSITNSDDYEIFVLSDARVAYESNGKLANLLSAYADTPLKVEGRLEPPARGQMKYFLKKPYKPVDVEVRHVTRFSYGQMTDGESIIWAQGKSGWFEIRPTKQYKSIYEDMVEAVDLLYFVTDIYNESKKRGAGPGPQLIFKEYAEDDRFACTDPEAATQIFNKHRMFLMMCFLNRAQGIGWSTSALYQYFRRHFPKDFDTCKARVEGRYTEVQPSQPLRPTRSSKVSPPRAASTPTSVSSKPRATRTAAASASAQKQEEHPKKNDNWWEAAALFEFMQKAVNQRVLRPGQNQITLDRIAKLIVKRYEIDELEIARSVLFVHASNLCYMMDHPRRQTVRFFADEPIYEELAAGHSLSAIDQRRAESVELKPRRDRSSLKEEYSNSSDTSMDEDEEEERKGKIEIFKTPVRRLPGRKKKGSRLSILRPKSGKFSGKGKGVRAVPGKGKRPIPDIDTSGDSDDERGEQTSDGDEMGIDTPTQALSPSREKRKFIETDSDEEEEKGRRKRAASASVNMDSPPTTTETDDEDNQEEEDTPEETGDAPLPLRFHPTHQATQEAENATSSVSPTIISTPLPTYTANGPRDSWNCTFDGCSQRIYGASKERGRRLITEHLEDHSKGREKVVGILWREQDKLNLPVSNLIKKIRDMSESSTPLFPESSLETMAAASRQQPVLIRRPA